MGSTGVCDKGRGDGVRGEGGLIVALVCMRICVHCLFMYVCFCIHVYLSIYRLTGLSRDVLAE